MRRLLLIAIALIQIVLNAKAQSAKSKLDYSFELYRTGQYQEAISFLKDVPIYKDNYFKDNQDFSGSLLDYIGILNVLALCNSELAQYDESVFLCKKGLSLIEKYYDKEHPTYAEVLNTLAINYFHLGQYKEAIHWGEEVLTILDFNFDKKNLYYTTRCALALNNLANYYEGLGRHKDAIINYKKALVLIEKIYGKKCPEYACVLGNLAFSFFLDGQYEKSINNCKKAIKIYKKKYAREHPDFTRLLSNLAWCHYELGQYQEAIYKGMESLQIKEMIFKKNHPSRAASLHDMAWFYFTLGNVTSLEKYALSSYDVCYNIVDNTFKYLTEYERNRFWEEYENQFIVLPHRYSYKYPTESLIKCGYNASLLSKGLLLNLSRSMSELIQSSGDQEALSLYNDIRLNRMTLQKQYERPIAERTLNTDSLEALTADMERELIKKSKIFGDYTKDMSIQWEDVQQRLDSFDIAIEFVDFPQGTDSTMYVALTLKKGYDCPHMVPLFEKRQLKAIPEGSFYTSPDLYNLVWKPLEKEISGVKNIYFSSSGELHRIAIENIPITTTEYISDRYNLRRLSSTRQLACHQDETVGEKSIVYGGLKYDAIIPDTKAVISSGQEREFSYVPHANVDSLKLRSSYEYLPGTKEETDSIIANLSIHSVPYSYYYGAAGTEDSFKNLDGTKPKLLHIATHGFYMSEEDAARKKIDLLPLIDNEKIHHEDKAMTRSGLLLSGCSRALKHETIPEGVEDGILTAAEISKLDMRGLDLVVLSACKTGLGDIISGEGVFGLQRGFKKAGAKTIIMSLWKVDDDATNLLMKEFYKNYCSGKVDKRESLRLAQKAVRKYKDEDGNLRFDSPYYWAAFVMLD